MQRCKQVEIGTAFWRYNRPPKLLTICGFIHKIMFQQKSYQYNTTVPLPSDWGVTGHFSQERLQPQLGPYTVYVPEFDWLKSIFNLSYVPPFSGPRVGLDAQLEECPGIVLGSIDWSILSRVSLLSSKEWYSLLFKLSRFDITLLFFSESGDPLNANIN